MTGLGFTVIEESNDVETTQMVMSAIVDVGGGNCPCDVGLTLSRIDETTWRVSFSRPVESNLWLSIPGNWRVYDDAEVAPDLVVYSSTPEASDDPTYVDLVTDEQRSGVVYRARAYILEAA